MALTWANPSKYDRPQDFAEARFNRGVFRCQRCEMLWPTPVRVQDGFRLCQRCWDPLSKIEAQNSMANERAANASDTPRYLEFPVQGAFEVDSAPIIQSFSTNQLHLTKGGASGTITATGLNFTTADTWSSSNSTHITVSATGTSASITLTISADGTTTRGDYDLTFNSVTQAPRGIISVR